MRTERPEPWGFDVWDPRLTMRQQAADAQHQSSTDDSEIEPAILDEPATAESTEPELVGAIK